MRPSADGGHDRFGVAEVLLVGRGVIDVERNIRAVPSAGGGQPQTVGALSPPLDRKPDPPAPAPHERANFLQYIRQMLARNRVLLLLEPDPPGTSEHFVRHVGIAAGAECPARNRVESG